MGVKKRITPKQRMDSIHTYQERRMKTVLKKHQQLRDLATEGWSSRNKPKFPSFVKRRRKLTSFGVIVRAPNAEQASISVYRMLNDNRGGGKATKVIKVILEKGYQRKTIPRRFGKFGKGGKIKRTKSGKPKLGKDKDGIEARLWDTLANDALEPDMTNAIIKGTQEGLRNA